MAKILKLAQPTINNIIKRTEGK